MPIIKSAGVLHFVSELKVRPSLSKLMRPRVTIVKKSPMSVFNALVVSIFSTIMLVLVTMMAD